MKTPRYSRWGMLAFFLMCWMVFGGAASSGLDLGDIFLSSCNGCPPPPPPGDDTGGAISDDVLASDSGGEVTTPSLEECTSDSDCEGFPCIDGLCQIDPSDPASLLNPGGLTTFEDFISHLQSDGTVDSSRASIIRGRVVDRDQEPIPGVRITIMGQAHREAATDSRGYFSIIAAGGDDVVLAYSKPGFLPVRRTVRTFWREFSWAPNVVMVGFSRNPDGSFKNAEAIVGGQNSPDGQIPTSSLLGGVPTWVAVRGDTVFDYRSPRLPVNGPCDPVGGRQVALYIPSNAAPVATSGIPGEHVSIRMKEFTEGSWGLDAMPAELPASVAFTYAAEFGLWSGDQEIAVEFANPAYAYVDNFLRFEVDPLDPDRADAPTEEEVAQDYNDFSKKWQMPPGTYIPSGYLDRDTGRWLAAPNGHVIEVNADAAGNWMAMGDRNGDGLLETLPAEEVQALKALFADRCPPFQLWRMPLHHFSAWDFNANIFPDPLAGSPEVDHPPTGDGGTFDPCELSGHSTIECENRVVRETVGVPGTPWSLGYSSSRVEGYHGASSVLVPLVKDHVPRSLVQIILQIEVAGLRYEYKWYAHKSTAPGVAHGFGDTLFNPLYTFTWNGLDFRGLPVAGAQSAKVRLGYRFGFAVKLTFPCNRANGVEWCPPLNETWLFESDAWSRYGETRETLADHRNLPIYWSEWKTVLRPGRTRGPEGSLAGWELDIQHTYDPQARLLFRGDGRVEGAESRGTLLLDKVAGNPNGDGTLCSCWKGVVPFPDCAPCPAEKVGTAGVASMAADAEGNLWLSYNQQSGHWVGLARLTADGAEVAAYSPESDSPHHGPVAIGVNGFVYEAFNVANSSVLTRSRPFGSIPVETILVGGTSSGIHLTRVAQLVVDPNGAVIFAGTEDTGEGGLVGRVWKARQVDGGDWHVAPLVNQPPIAGDPDQSLRNALPTGAIPRGVALGSGGVIFVSAGEEIFVMRPGAQAGELPSLGHFGQAIGELATSRFGELYFISEPADPNEVNGIFKVDNPYPPPCSEPPCTQQELLATRLSGSLIDELPDAWPAPGEPGSRITHLTVGPNGDVYFVDVGAKAFFKYTQYQPNLAREFWVRSRDGLEEYRFAANTGRHLETRDVMTGLTKYTFQYPAEDDGTVRPLRVLDQLGRATEIVTYTKPDGGGGDSPVLDRIEIIPPKGRTTTLLADANGYAEWIGWLEWGFGYDDKGLLKFRRDPNGNYARMQYNALGRLEREDLLRGAGQTTTIESATTLQGIGTSSGVQVLVREGATPTSATDATLTGGIVTEHAIPLLDRWGTRTITRSLGTGASDDGQAHALVTTIEQDGPVSTATMPNGTVIIDAEDPVAVDWTRSQTIAVPDHVPVVMTHSRSGEPAGSAGLVSDDVVQVGGIELARTTVRDEISLGGTMKKVYRKTPNGRIDILTLNASGRLRSVAAGCGDMASPVACTTPAPVYFTYDNPQEPLPSLVQQGGRSVALTYDDSGYLASISNTQTGLTTSFTRDDFGRVLSVVGPDGAQTTIGRDANGNVVEVVPDERPSHTLGYTVRNQLASYVSPPVGSIADTTTWEHGPRRELKRVVEPDGGALDFAYDPDSGRLIGWTASSGATADVRYCTAPGQVGNICSVASPTHRLAFQWSGSLLRGVSRHSQQRDVLINYTYDSLLRPSTMEIDSLPITSRYDNPASLLPTGLMIGGLGTVARLPDDPAGPIGRYSGSSAWGVSGTLTEAVAYDQYEALDALNYWTGTELLYSEELSDPGLGAGRDPDGRIAFRRDTIGQDVVTRKYEYDRSGRIKSVRDGNNNVIEVHSFGENGTRTAWYEGGRWFLASTPSNDAGYDVRDQLVWLTRTDGTTTEYSEYTWSRAGRLESRRDDCDGQSRFTSYQYDEVGQLRQATVPPRTGTGAPKVVSYDIDGLNRRTVRRINGVPVQQFVYDGFSNRIVEELNGSGGRRAIFVYAGRHHVPDYMVDYRLGAPRLYRLVTDHLGSVRLVVAVETGEVVRRYDYTTFGAVTSIPLPGKPSETSDSESWLVPFGFAGGLYDPTTGLVRFGARDYDPEIGSWTARDPILFGGGDTNLLGYCVGDPVNYVDPEGRAPDPVAVWNYISSFRLGTEDANGAWKNSAEARGNNHFRENLVDAEHYLYAYTKVYQDGESAMKWMAAPSFYALAKLFVMFPKFFVEDWLDVASPSDYGSWWATSPPSLHQIYWGTRGAWDALVDRLTGWMCGGE